MDVVSAPPRLIVADDNISDTGGHYFELASLLLDGGAQLGYRGILATNASFSDQLNAGAQFQVLPTFHTRRLIHWSLGVDGNSKYERDIDGRSIGGNLIQNACINLVDRFRPKRPPTRMLSQWADDLAQLLTTLDVTAADRLLINTGDDFAMLALAAALRRCDVPPLQIDVIFHFALYDGRKPDRARQLQQLGEQTRRAIARLAYNRVSLHATTTNLAGQMREAGLNARDIPYPTRSRRQRPAAQESEAFRIVLAGLPRKEKGRSAIVDTLASIENAHLRSGDYRMSMQMPARRWQRMIPPSLRTDFEQALGGFGDGPMEVMTNNLSPKDYHAWLDTSDIGLFLYDPDRYVARCSGVLLEMMVRGVPVIVPEGCWLADQVRLAGGDGSIGYIYQNRCEISGLLSRFSSERDQVLARSRDYATTIAARHRGKNTLREMGLKPVEASKTTAA